MNNINNFDSAFNSWDLLAKFFDEIGKCINNSLEEKGNSFIDLMNEYNNKSSEDGGKPSNENKKEDYVAPEMKENKVCEENDESKVSNSVPGNTIVTKYVNNEISDEDEINEIISAKLSTFSFYSLIDTKSLVKAEFSFKDRTYTFEWNPATKRFEGTMKELIGAHCDGNGEPIKDYDRHTIYFLQAEKRIVVDDDMIDGCEFYKEPFYPYGEKCKNCRKVDECFPPVDEETYEPRESASAVYDEVGNAIVEEDIPSLEDYTAYDEQAGEPCDNEENMKYDNGLLAQELFNNINKQVGDDVRAIIPDVLEGFKSAIACNLYDVDKTILTNDGKVNVILVKVDDVTECMLNRQSKPLDEVIPVSVLQNAIKTEFGFAGVTLQYDNNHNKVFVCQLV